MQLISSVIHTELKILIKHAQTVRARLETFSRASGDSLWKDFPNGSCGITSELLGRYLIDLGYSDVLYVFGIKDGRSHAWVTVTGTIVDITGDQFDSASVVVADESEWHGAWKIEDQPRPPICDPSQWISYPLDAWAAINGTAP